MADACIDPGLQAALGAPPQMASAAETLPGTRPAMAAMFLQTQPAAAAALVERLTIPEPDGAPPVRVVSHRPSQADAVLPAILHIHGGGFVLGSPEMADAGNQRPAVELGCGDVSHGFHMVPDARVSRSAGRIDKEALRRSLEA